MDAGGNQCPVEGVGKRNINQGVVMALNHMNVEGSELLRVEGIDVSIDGREILRDVNFRIDHGEFTGLIGANGSGKTTLFRVILGLQAAAGGRVTVHGETLQRSNRSIGYVPQKVLFDPDMPIRARDLVALGVDGNRYGFARRTRANHVAVEKNAARGRRAGLCGS
jgi:zinc/manganese transport system ATP-binding protein